MINWYREDKRFTPGTVADHEYIRITLAQMMRNNRYVNTWRLYLLIRTYKEDGIKDDLKRGVAALSLKM